MPGKKGGKRSTIANPALKKKNNQNIQDLLKTANQAHINNNLDEAARAYAKVLKSQPEHPDALLMLGTICMERGLFEDADRFMRDSLRVRPNSAQSLNNHGTLLKQWGSTNEAIEQYSRAIEIDPAYTQARINLGNTYYVVENYVDALLQYREAQRQSETFEILNGLGLVLMRLGYLEAAAEAHVKSLQLDPNRFEGYNNLAEVFRDQRKFQAAIQAYTAAARLKPSDLKPIWNRAFSELEVGDLNNGFRDYEAGLSTKNRRPLDFGVPRWDGKQLLTDKKLGIAVEQGLGDEILFSTYYPEVHEMAGKTLLTCDPRLADAWGRLLPDATIIPVTKNERAQQQWALPEGVEEPDLQVAAGSLPGIAFRNKGDIPEPKRTLYPEPNLEEKWRQRVRELPQGLRVGICWRSGKLNVRRSWSYLQDNEISPLLNIEGATFVNLQYNATEDDLVALETGVGTILHRWEDLDQYNDLEQVIALVANLDLVISVASVPSRLASAVGTESWRLVGQDPLSLGRDYVPFFSNTPVWRFSEFTDKEEFINSIAEKLKEKTEERT